jgi:hypothetical protein
MFIYIYIHSHGEHMCYVGGERGVYISIRIYIYLGVYIDTYIYTYIYMYIYAQTYKF